MKKEKGKKVSVWVNTVTLLFLISAVILCLDSIKWWKIIFIDKLIWYRMFKLNDIDMKMIKYF